MSISRSVGERNILSAVIELRARLRDGALTASGIHWRDGERRKIEPSEWIDLELTRDDIAVGLEAAILSLELQGGRHGAMAECHSVAVAERRQTR